MIQCLCLVPVKEFESYYPQKQNKTKQQQQKKQNTTITKKNKERNQRKQNKTKIYHTTVYGSYTIIAKTQKQVRCTSVCDQTERETSG